MDLKKVTGHDIIEMFKIKYNKNDIMNLSHKPYGGDTLIHAFKSFDDNGESLSSICWNPTTDFFECHYGDGVLKTYDKLDVIWFMRL